MNAACRGGEEGEVSMTQGRGGERRARVEEVEAKEGNGGDNWRCEVSLEWVGYIEECRDDHGLGGWA